VQLQEHKHNLKEGLLEKSKLAQHAWDEGHRVDWDEVRILEIESSSRYRKYKESAHMACLTNPISQSSLDISSIWIPLISNEVVNSQKKPISCKNPIQISVWSPAHPIYWAWIGEKNHNIFFILVPSLYPEY
jgi:hypothetical protein